jgi:hypothetical protein
MAQDVGAYLLGFLFLILIYLWYIQVSVERVTQYCCLVPSTNGLINFFSPQKHRGKATTNNMINKEMTTLQQLKIMSVLSEDFFIIYLYISLIIVDC